MSETLSLKTLDERVSAIEALIPKNATPVAEVAEVKPKTSFEERRKLAAESKVRHDARGGVQTVEGNAAIMAELDKLRAQKNAQEPADPRSPNRG